MGEKVRGILFTMKALDVNFWLLSPTARLTQWRLFRRSLSECHEKEIPNIIWDTWMASPEVSIAIDPYDISKWPTLWEIIQQGHTCKFSKALAMSYTIHYLNLSKENNIMRVFDPKTHDTYYASIIDGKLYSPNSIEAMNAHTEILTLTIEESWTVQQVLDEIEK
jgi:hypothetical protein